MVPQLAQGLVNKFLNQPSYMQGVTAVVTMLSDSSKLPRVSRYKWGWDGPAVGDKVRRRKCGSTEFVASGHFSVCFKHTDNAGNEYVIKVSLRNDDGAVPYYKWLWDNKKWLDREHFPELFFFGKVRGFDVCVMEWLDACCWMESVDYWAATGDRYEVEKLRHEHNSYTMTLLEAGEELNNLALKLRLNFDIHSENMRCRYDGTVVFSDPFGFIRKEH